MTEDDDALARQWRTHPFGGADWSSEPDEQAHARRLLLIRLDARATVRHGLARAFLDLQLPAPAWKAVGIALDVHDCGRVLTCLGDWPILDQAERLAAGAARARLGR